MNAETIRAFEREGIIEAPPRTAGNYRDYTDGHLAQLRFIKALQSVGIERSIIAAVMSQARGRGSLKQSALAEELARKRDLLELLASSTDSLGEGRRKWAAALIDEFAARQKSEN